MGLGLNDYSGDEGRDKEYVISCLCIKKKIRVAKSETQKKEEDSFHVLLLPRESTERDLFYGAWLPSDELDPDDTDQEVLADVGYPYEAFRVRFSLARRNRLCSEDHHLQVMDEELRKKLYETAIGKNVTLRVLPEREELKNAGII